MYRHRGIRRIRNAFIIIVKTDPTTAGFETDKSENHPANSPVISVDGEQF